MSKMKWNLGDVAEFLNFNYDTLVEWIQQNFIDDSKTPMRYLEASEIADEMCDKMRHMGEIQTNSTAQSDEAKAAVKDMMGENAS